MERSVSSALSAASGGGGHSDFKKQESPAAGPSVGLEQKKRKQLSSIFLSCTLERTANAMRAFKDIFHLWKLSYQCTYNDAIKPDKRKICFLNQGNEFKKSVYRTMGGFLMG